MTYTINWLGVLENFLRGLCWGTGFSLALLIYFAVAPYLVQRFS